jgi:four helix bundle protein
VFKDIQQVPPKRGADVLCNQVIRSIGSIGANIAEGFNRSKKRYLNSLDIALGEAAEAKNWLYKLRDTELMEKGKANGHVLKVIEIQKMLHGLIQSIETCEDGSRGPG